MKDLLKKVTIVCTMLAVIALIWVFAGWLDAHGVDTRGSGTLDPIMRHGE